MFCLEIGDSTLSLRLPRDPSRSLRLPRDPNRSLRLPRDPRSLRLEGLGYGLVVVSQ